MQIRQQRIVDNLTKVAQELIDYILRAPHDLNERALHRDGILTILNDVKKSYNATSYTRLESIIYYFTRGRSSQIESANVAVADADPADPLALLDIITGLLQEGGCESTSANTLLLSKLMNKLGRYQSLESELSQAAQVEIRTRLRDLFVARAKETLRQYQQIIEKNAAILKIEKPIVHKLDIDSNFKRQLEGTLEKTHEPRKVGKLKDKNLSSVVNKLETLYGKGGPKPRSSKPTLFNQDTSEKLTFKERQEKLENLLKNKHRR